MRVADPWKYHEYQNKSLAHRRSIHIWKLRFSFLLFQNYEDLRTLSHFRRCCHAELWKQTSKTSSPNLTTLFARKQTRALKICWFPKTTNSNESCIFLSSWLPNIFNLLLLIFFPSVAFVRIYPPPPPISKTVYGSLLH